MTPAPPISAGLRAFGNLVAPGGARARLSILIYHRVLARPDPVQPGEIDAEVFTRHLRALIDHFRVLPLDEALTRLEAGSLPARAACITFDDGYADNHDVALPLLQRFGMHATFFIATRHLDGGRMWNDSITEAVRRAPGPALDLSALSLGVHSLETPDARAATARHLVLALRYLPDAERVRQVTAIARELNVPLPDDLMMTRAQVRALHAAGMGIGAHTVSHPILTRVDLPTARAEIADGRADLEASIGAPVSLFAYPNGRPGRDYAAEHVALVRELGFRAALSTAWGTATRACDRFQIPRFTPWDRRPTRFVVQLLRNCLRRTIAAV